MRLLSTILCGFCLLFGASMASAQDPALHDMLPAYASVFAGKGKAPFQVPHQNLLDTSKLDGSLKSLAEVDTYLGKLMKEDVTLSLKDISMVSMLAGSYIGEVIISASKNEHRWMPFSEYAKSHPSVTPVEPGSVYTEYLLVSGDASFSMPIYQVAHLLDSGKTFSANAFATEQLK